MPRFEFPGFVRAYGKDEAEARASAEEFTYDTQVGGESVSVSLDDGTATVMEDDERLILYTASWTALKRRFDEVGSWEEFGLVPVRTSVGKPRFWPAAIDFPYCAAIAPVGLLKLTGEKFDEAYVARLADTGARGESGVERIRKELEQISLAHGGKPLVLLCFEKDPKDCHRGVFAKWWEQQTAEPVTELFFEGATS